MNGNIRLIIVARTLNKEELEEFNKWEIVPKITKIAYDAVAFIGSKDLKDSLLTFTELTSLLTGSSSKNYKNTKNHF